MTGITYDLEGEQARLSFPDVSRGGVTLNRATARAAAALSEPPEFEAARERHRASIVRTTLVPEGPVIELDRPSAGIYVESSRGVYLDLYLGVGQRLFDDSRLLPRLQPLIDAGLLLRREINTDDFLSSPPPGVRLPQDLAETVLVEAMRVLPRRDGYRVFFSNSGAEAVEAALKATTLAAYHRFLAQHGPDAWAAVCGELQVRPDPYFTVHPPLWEDYPLFVIALEGAFHGRTLGSLSLTKSRPAQGSGFPRWRWARHVPPRETGRVEALIDPRPLADVLAEPGQLARSVAAGRIPLALLAGAIYEPFQGEGGYRFPSPAVVSELRNACDRAGGLLIADEVQTFARGGTSFLSSTQAVRPDVVCTAKAAVLGITLIPTEAAASFAHGWHSNSFGSGKLFDVNYACAAWETFLGEREPAFNGLSFAENEAVKGRYLGERLDGLVRRHPAILADPEGTGCMWGLTAVDRDAFVREAWRQGAKILGAGAAVTPGRFRIILPADVLTREVDAVVEVLDRTCSRLEDSLR